MTPRRSSLALSVALAWIAIWEPLVPADRRITWRDQWRADLWHYWAWLNAAGIPAITARVRLLRRASAALPHALVLRIRDWSPHMISHDVRFAWRMSVRRPAFTIIAVAILGLGIGANATIFSWVETTLLRPLPGVRDQDRLVALRGTTKSRSDLAFSYPNYQDVRNALPDGLEDVIAFRGLALSVRTEGAEPVRVWGELVTPNFFDVLRVGIIQGRGFTPADAQTPGHEPVVVLAHRGWQRLFHGDPSVVGRPVTINGQAFTVNGIAEEGFQGSLVGVALDVFVPITMQAAVMSGSRLGQRGNSFLQVFGRQSPGASLATTRASLSVIGSRLAAAYPDANEGRSIDAMPLWRDGASGMLLPVMATLMAVVGVVLLIACANLAGLLLARAAGRQREVAVRLAMGASRPRLIRQFLIESLMLAAGGGLAGIALSYWTAGMLRAFIPPTPIPIDLSAGVSTTVIGFSILITFIAAVVFGLVPALRASRPDVSAALKDAGASLTSGSARGWLRQALVVAQVALSVVLLVCAALFVRSLQHAHVIDPGFSLRQGLLGSIDLLSNGYDQKRGIVFYQQLQQRLGSVPGIESATVTAAMPLDISSGSDMGVRIDGYAQAPGEEITVYYNRVGARYFETMGISLVDGRAIDERDVDGRELAVVINETMARRYWPNRSAIGAIVRFGAGPARVVGIARDGKYRRLNEEPRNYMYVPVSQYYRPDLVVLVRTTGEPSSVLAGIQAQVRALDPGVPLFDIRTMEEHLQFSVFMPRMVSTLLGLFGMLALVLALVGLYGVIAYTVAQRTREIGIRMALGAARGEVVRLVLRQGLVLTLAGLLIGLVLAIAAGRLIAGQLIGIGAGDPVSFGATIVALLVVAAAATAVPARRAATIDPLDALRTQ